MKNAVLVTGNKSKLRELQAIFPTEFELESRALDLDEIQSLDPHEVVADKLKRAYKIVGKAVIVEDVSAELTALKGFPGTFMKFAEQLLGPGALYELCKGHGDKRATVSCTMGYYDGKEQIIVDGVVKGTIVKPRGKHGFGFDFSFVMDGETRTNAEMTPEDKNQKSHRYRAVQALVNKLAS